ncbi:MAG: ribonuclease III [Candidatus Magasanikbacteria bacterium RIFOXYC2_FULL_40_16]|uniref:Ribonuclease 3 n=3 Tax=Candidatus Magasanikiibacteriota TaxID=1752731 RepID=A0A1F6NEY7_9BACT|nr:MAG: ribonuclease III [Candidatus Magasanikbacteria bacterium RIFOXYA2_FULL_40_20]OGH82391.1 MAG: ribonuclease III [Candidatus Magasanikbacteria bacterium RIFOXYB1_FULL_40_15]OGH85126.1 MAG: ribonuclease III [Candidatus Magasanikbacteria bacterium RIFOXYB2_FULL_40_13]OGH87871.1 MAG: ribonuclease III [Candidatus Magasanikbacteria bacterium RIFOXYA1_FULL_40_8]OGH89371.1 MAG: ribonuclease III [Candidatus Magasanikbacteria bacterium RIFOXYC2_FULL_40_16]
MTIASYEEKKFADLEEKIGVNFKNKDYLVQSLVHRSYLNENREFPLAHNERLEFLGDAVLELVVTEYLFENFLNPEGELTNWRAALVNAKMCSVVASEIGLENYLFLSRGESKDAGTKAREYILANVLEAIIGAIYLDQGWDITKQFITRWVISKLPEVLDQGLWMDPKSRLQESAQELVGVTPTYKVLKEEGPDHDKIFVVGVYLEKEKIAEGQGGSKQEAQVEAAERALREKKWKGPKVEILNRKENDPIG